MNLLDPRFKYVPAASTDVADTWRRFGFRPVTNEERRARLPTDRPEETKYLFAGGRDLAPTRPSGSIRPE